MAIFLVRHAKAGSRSAWTDSDSTRPLDDSGLRQATAIAQHWGHAAPVAVSDSLNRPNTTTVAKVLKADLLGNDTDADSDPLTLTAVGNALPAGATVTKDVAGNTQVAAVQPATCATTTTATLIT